MRPQAQLAMASVMVDRRDGPATVAVIALGPDFAPGSRQVQQDGCSDGWQGRAVGGDPVAGLVRLPRVNDWTSSCRTNLHETLVRLCAVFMRHLWAGR